MSIRGIALVVLASAWIGAPAAQAQVLFDPSLRVQTYLQGLDAPTGAVFLNNRGDLLVTQKNDGRVLIVRDRKIVGSALDLPVANNSQRGLLSIALSPNFVNDNRVYLFHTAAAQDGGAAISNKISRYRLVGNELVFDRKIIDLPVDPGPNHNGGKIAFDHKGMLYVTIGDLNRQDRTQNVGRDITHSGAILRMSANGKPIPTNPFNIVPAPLPAIGTGSTAPLAPVAAGTVNIIQPAVTAAPYIFAYGIRNSFGIAFDPVSGDLWDTEHGPGRFDEINRVRPGFNSGWRKVMGPIAQSPSGIESLAMLGSNAHYADPKLSFEKPVGLTDLHFYAGGKLGEDYHNDLFVGDANTGSLYHFDLNSHRKSLRLMGPLGDYVVNNGGNLLDETDDIRLGADFGAISDILSGPGGLYVLSATHGRLFRVQQVPAPPMLAMRGPSVMLPEPGCASATILFAMVLARRRCNG